MAEEETLQQEEQQTITQVQLDPALPPRKRPKSAQIDDGKHLFSCDKCGERFTRYENLKRHQRNHDDNVVLEKCPECEVTCKRRDLLKRHIKKFHADVFEKLYSTLTSSAPRSNAKNGANTTPRVEVNDTTDAAQTLTSLAMPAANDLDASESFASLANGLTNGLSNFTPSFPFVQGDVFSRNSSSGVIDSVTAAMSSLTKEQIDHYLNSYFLVANKRFPVVHQPTFDARSLPLLTAAMVCIGMESSNSLALWNELVYPFRAMSFEIEDGLQSKPAQMQARLLLAYYGLANCGTDAHATGMQMLTALIVQLRRTKLPAPTPSEDIGQLWKSSTANDTIRMLANCIYLLTSQAYMTCNAPISISVFDLRALAAPDELSWYATSAKDWQLLNITESHNPDVPTLYQHATQGTLQAISSLDSLSLIYTVLKDIRSMRESEMIAGNKSTTLRRESILHALGSLGTREISSTDYWCAWHMAHIHLLVLEVSLFGKAGPVEDIVRVIQRSRDYSELQNGINNLRYIVEVLAMDDRVDPFTTLLLFEGGLYVWRALQLNTEMQVLISGTTCKSAAVYLEWLEARMDRFDKYGLNNVISRELLKLK